MEETRRMSTAATAAYQAAQVESRIWLSESSTRDSWREDGEARKRSMRRVARGEGTAPKHPCMNAHSLARFPHLPGERVCVSPRLCSLARETPHDSRVPPASSCASVIMCSHIGVPERSTEGEGEEDERNIGNGAEYEGGSPVNLEVDRTPCMYELDLYMCV